MEIKKRNSLIAFFVLLEIFLFVIFFSFFPQGVFAGVGENVTVTTLLSIGNAFPEVLNVTIQNNESSITLVLNDTREIFCTGLVRDYNGWEDINHATAVFFHPGNSTYEGTDDNNHHYTNHSCDIIQDGIYTAIVNCTFDIWYYANPGTTTNAWNCTIRVNDSLNKEALGSGRIAVSQLLGLGVPDFIDYGEVNASEVSLEVPSDVINYGNVMFNLSLNGYGFVLGDGNAMNCTLGAIGNISIQHEKYNLTNSNPGVIDLAQANANYTNLTSSLVVPAAAIKKFMLAPRQDDVSNDAIKPVYWRIFVPSGVAGTCQGNIIFGATTARGN